MEYIVLNSLLKSTLNKTVWYNIKLATKCKRKINQNVFDYYIIEYKLLYGDKKIKMDNFTYSSYLSEFGKKERFFIARIISLRTIPTVVVTKTVMV